jgi:hypothetical protein
METETVGVAAVGGLRRERGRRRLDGNGDAGVATKGKDDVAGWT